MGKIMLLLALMTSLCSFGQSRPIHYQAGLLKASATIAPTNFYRAYSTSAMLNGYLEYIVEERISIRGDIFQYIPGVGRFVFNHLNMPQNYTAIYAGFGYQLGKKNWKHTLHIQPGITYTQIGATIANPTPRYSVNPSINLKAGTCLYVSPYFHFFAEINWNNSSIRNNPESSSISTAQVGVSAGLGFNIQTRRK